ncbi:MAG: hypothetical protein JRD84_06485 [Deltaproteobacteria bacterium]|nr:hypothetical protein [Deltaproteobacteria bacterium]
MARAKTTKKAAARISKKSDALIVELSLQNPDFGAKRLVPLLKQKKVSVSSSQIYGVLKRHDLQTREKRLARIENPAPQKAKTPPAKSSTKISDETAEQIVEISLQNPEFGSKRLLPLLQESGIDASTSKVYSILKRRGLQTCDLRRSRMELERLTDGAPPDFETEAPYAVPIPAVPDEPEISETRPVIPSPSVVVTSPRRARWFFYLADLCLLALVGYLGYLGYHTVLNFKQSRLQPEAIAAVKPEPARRAVQPQIAIEPLKGYHKIWERNLFNIPKEAPAAAKTEIPIETIALAEKNIGLKLVGTVVANDAHFSRAIVQVTKTREQGAYREGDQAGKAKIKKILRNKVVITTEKGDQLLTIDDEDFGKGGKAVSKQQGASRGLTSPQPNAGGMRFDVSGSQLPRRRARSINLKHDEVAASLTDTDQLLQELTISPFMQNDQPAGFIISKIPRGSILTKMGLRNGYVVTQLNDQEITSPDQADEFFRTLAEGGEVTIQVRRSRGVRRRARQINLNIQ